jgi:hypothetical protein
MPALCGEDPGKTPQGEPVTRIAGQTKQDSPSTGLPGEEICVTHVDTAG